MPYARVFTGPEADAWLLSTRPSRRRSATILDLTPSAQIGL